MKDQTSSSVSRCHVSAWQVLALATSNTAILDHDAQDQSSSLLANCLDQYPDWPQHRPDREQMSYFKCTRLNPETFLIVENDEYGEHPFIYVKLFTEPAVVVLSDTGCGGSFDASKPSQSTLRDFIETGNLAANGGRPLNPRDSNHKPYLIICTHCHYDHILGLPHFIGASSTILASSYDKSFVTEDLSVHSLCQSVGADTPEYTVSHWARDLEEISFAEESLHLQILHTPGHTPDELAWYDQQARHLFVGDSFYERVSQDESYEQAILFPKEGNIVQYMDSLTKLLGFVNEKNKEENQPRVKVGCGHVTSSRDGGEILLAVQKLFSQILAGEIPVLKTTEKAGEYYDLWQASGNARFSVEAPRRLITDARLDTGS